jgi:hypothetical protein
MPLDKHAQPVKGFCAILVLLAEYPKPGEGFLCDAIDLEGTLTQVKDSCVMQLIEKVP